MAFLDSLLAGLAYQASATSPQKGIWNFLIWGIITKIVVVLIVITLGTMIWNKVLTQMIPGLQETTAFGIFALWLFIGLIMS